MLNKDKESISSTYAFVYLKHDFESSCSNLSLAFFHS